MYSRILTEKSFNSELRKLKIEIVQQLSSLYNKLFGIVFAKAKKEIAKYIKIQLVFDAIILVGIAYIIYLMLKILKNQNVQTESLVLTEAINFNSAAGTVAKILGTTVGFILLVDGILYNIAFFKGYLYQGDELERSIAGFTNIINRLKKLADNFIEATKQVEKYRKQLDDLEGVYAKVISTAYQQRLRFEIQAKEGKMSSNAFVRFFKTYTAVMTNLNKKEWFEIIATPIILATLSLRIELPSAYENLKAKIAKYKRGSWDSKFILELVDIGGTKRDLSDYIFIYNGNEVTDNKEKEKLNLSFSKDFPTKRDIVHSDYLTISKNKNRIFIRVSVEDNRNFILYNVYIFKIDTLDAEGVKMIIDIILKYVDKYKRRIMEETKTLDEIANTLKKLYNIRRK